MPDLDRTVALKHEADIRAAVKRLVRVALSINVEVTVQRRDLELLLAVLTEKRGPDSA